MLEAHGARFPSLPIRMETPRLTLTAMVGGEVARLTGIIDAERAHLAPWIDVAGPQQLASRVHELIRAAEDGSRRSYVVRAGDEIVGVVAVAHGAGGALPQLSYWLRAAATGKGYATEMVGALCERLLTQAEAVEIRCRADNRASARVARRLGFVLVATLEEAGLFWQRWIGDQLMQPVCRALVKTCAAVEPVRVDDDVA